MAYWERARTVEMSPREDTEKEEEGEKKKERVEERSGGSLLEAMREK